MIVDCRPLDANKSKRPLPQHCIKYPVASGRKFRWYHGPMGDDAERTSQKEKTTSIDMAGLFGPRHDRFIGPPQSPLRNHIIAMNCPAVTRVRSFDAGLHVVAVQPIIGIKHSDAIIFLSNRNQRTDTPRGLATVAVFSIDLYMPYPLTINPLLGKTISNEEVIGGHGLVFYAIDGALQQVSVLFVIWRNDCIAFMSRHRPIDP